MPDKTLNSIILFLTLSLSYIGAYSQNDRFEDLLQQLETATNDSVIVHTNRQLGHYYYERNPEKAIEYYKAGIIAAERLGDSISLGNFYFDIGGAYNFKQNIPKALENYLQSVRIYDKLNDSWRLTNTYIRISHLYISDEDIDKQIEYLNYAEDQAKRSKDKIQLSNFYGQKGVIYDQRKIYDSALVYLKKCVKLAKESNDQYTIASAYTNLGLTYKHMGNVDDAQKEYKKALKIFQDNSDTLYMSILYNNIASAYTQDEDYESGEKYFNLSIYYGKPIGMQQVLLDGYKSLSDLYGKKLDYKNQAEFLEKYYALKDSLFTAEKENQLSQLENDYIIEKKDLELEAQQLDIDKKKQQNTLYIILFVFSVLTLCFLLFYFIKTRKKNILLQSQNRLIKEQKTTLEKTLHDLKATQLQLIQSEKMASLGELTAGIAHEIQNPLNFVNNFSEVSHELIDEMNEELDNGEIDEAKAISKDVKQNLEKITYHGKRADSIVKGMLQHSRTNSGEKEETDINKLTDEYMRLAYHGLRAKDKSFNATLETHFDQDLKPLNVVSQEIGRVLLNLFTNSYYAVNEKQQQLKTVGETDFQPKISATTSKTKAQIIIKVKDNGNGIPEFVKQKIFQPFFTTKPTGKGTGLGLSMSYDIIRNHGGELKVKTKEGEFTEFEINLPLKTNT